MPEAREYPWKNIGDRIREARTKLGLTQKELAGQVGVTSQTVWSWEAGRVKPKHEHLEELAYRSARSAPPGFWAGTCWRRNCSRRPACPSMTPWRDCRWRTSRPSRTSSTSSARRGGGGRRRASDPGRSERVRPCGASWG